MTGFVVMLETEEVPQFVSQHGEQTRSVRSCAAGLEFGIVVQSGIDEPAEAGGILVDPNDVSRCQSQQVLRQIGDEELLMPFAIPSPHGMIR